MSKVTVTLQGAYSDRDHAKQHKVTTLRGLRTLLNSYPNGASIRFGCAGDAKALGFFKLWDGCWATECGLEARINA